METRMQRADIQAPSTPEQYRAALDRQERVIAGLRKRLEVAESKGSPGRRAVDGIDLTNSYPISFNDGRHQVPGIPEGTIPQISAIKGHPDRYATAFVVQALCEYAEKLESALMECHQ